MQFPQKWTNKKCFWKKSINKWTSGSLLEENLYNIGCSTRFRPLEPLKHSYFEENGPEKIDFYEISEKYFPDFAIYLKIDADSDFDTLIYDL